MKRSRLALIIAALPALLLVPAATAAQAAPVRGGSLAVVTGVLPAPATAAAPATVYLFGVPQIAHMKPGQQITVPVLARQRVTAGSAFSLTIPINRFAASVADQRTGRMNIQLDVFSPAGSSVRWEVVRVAHAGSVSAPVAAVGRLPSYSMAQLRRSAAAGHMSPAAMGLQAGPDIIPCHYQDYTYKYGIDTRIGELHAATGNTGTYSYTNEVDSTFTVGFNDELGDGFTASGEAGVTQTSGIGETFSEGGYYSQYVDGKYDYEQYLQGGDTCESGFVQEGYQWDGSAFPGGNSAPGRFVNNCTSDPTNVPLPAGDSSEFKETGVSVFYQGGISEPYGNFSFGGRTGYSNDAKMQWHNGQSSQESWLCGPNNDGEFNIRNWSIVYDYNG
jgi:hypothetical protein